MTKRYSVRKWAFWGGVIGLVGAWGHFPNLNVAGVRDWIELPFYPALFAGPWRFGCLGSKSTRLKTP
jgi:hypothetical protein